MAPGFPHALVRGMSAELPAPEPTNARNVSANRRRRWAQQETFEITLPKR